MNAGKRTYKYIAVLAAVLVTLAAALVALPVKAEESPAATSERTVAVENNAEIVRFDYRSDAVNVLVTLTNPADLPENAELSVTPVEITEDMQKSIDDEAVNQQKAIESASAFDIRFLVDGQEVQPGSTVKVQVSLPEITADADASVYHYDEAAKATENMNAVVTEDGQVEFDTPHFSTYIIVNTSNSPIEVTIEHYNQKTNQPLYAADKKTLKVGDQIKNYNKASNWDVAKVVKVEGDKETDIPNPESIQLTQDTTLRVYYKAKTQEVLGQTSFYDYLVKPYYYDNNKKVELKELGINAGKNYNVDAAWNVNAKYHSTANDKDHRLGAGNNNGFENFKENQYHGYVNENGGDINAWTKGATTIKGIVTGLSGGTDGYENVTYNYNFYAPDLFSNQDIEIGKKVINDYHLGFTQSGDTYRLEKVYDEENKDTGAAPNAFFPLDSYLNNLGGQPITKYYYEGYPVYDTFAGNNWNESTNHNYYFGMRYDIDFTLGDYVGDLNYSFTGDDDLWVILDGKQVVIDLGGIHNAANDSVNLWDKIGVAQNGEDRTEAQKTQKHRLTILYMERGGNASKCNMNFTIPNAQIVEVTTTPKADLNFDKVDEADNGLAGAQFSIASESNPDVVLATATSLEEGKVSFKDLKLGSYILTETQAPDGHVASGETWKVKVTLDEGGEAATAKLYKSDGITEVTDNQIVNYSTKDHIQQDKTATVTSWDDRTYTVDLYAAHNIQVDKPVDVVLAIDVSGSMPWYLEAPGTATTVDKLTDADKKSETLDKGDLQGTYNAWDYQYYVEQEGEYHPIAYIKDTSSRGWYAVKSDSNGNKVINKNKKLEINTVIYKADKTMHQTKLEATKTAVENFISNLAGTSPESKVGIVTFAGDVKYEMSTLNTAAEVKNNLDTIFNNITLYGGTNQATGMEAAQKLLAGNTTSGNSQYMVLFTDGAPNGVSVEEVNKAAAKVKDAGTTLFCAGLYNTETAEKQGENLERWASEGCSYNATSTTELINAFNAIFGKISLQITGVTIIDTIDPRFDVVDPQGNKLEEGAVVNGGTLHYDESGNAYVIWSDQTLSYASEVKNGWHGQILIKAKADYIGGNNVPTNVPGAASSIIVNGENTTFGEPKVNVKADLPVTNVTNTYFWGETANNSGVQQTMSKGETLKDMIEGTYQSIDAKLTKTWYSDTALQNVLTDGINAMPAVPEQNAVYYLQTSYQLGQATDESTANTTIDGKGYIAGDADTVGKDSKVVSVNDTKVLENGQEKTDESLANKAYGVYTVHVVKGQLEITKNIDDQYTKIQPIKANQTFVFKIERYEVNEDGSKGELAETFYETINFNANETDNKKTKTISGLKRGYYTVTEETTWSGENGKYQLNTAKTTDNYEDNATAAADLFIGKRQGTENNLPKFYGLDNTKVKDSDTGIYAAYATGDTATTGFTNNIKSGWKWLSDTAAAVNVFDKDN